MRRTRFHAVAKWYLRKLYKKIERRIKARSIHPILPSPSLEKQVSLVLETKTSLEEEFQPVSLPGERVDNISARFDERRLEHVGQEREDTVKWLEVALTSRNVSVGDSGEKLGKNGEIKDERGRKERVFTFVENVHDVSSTHEKFRVILVDCSFYSSAVSKGPRLESH